MNRNGNEIPGWGHPEISEGSDQLGNDEAVARLVTAALQTEVGSENETAKASVFGQDPHLDRIFFGPDRYEI
jgi:hypothetical protein